MPELQFSRDINLSREALGYDPAQFDTAPDESSQPIRTGSSSFVEQARAENPWMFKSTLGHQTDESFQRNGVRGVIDTRAVGHDVNGYTVRTTGPCVVETTSISPEGQELIDRSVYRDSRGRIISLLPQVKPDYTMGDQRLSNSDGSTTWRSAIELSENRMQGTEYKLTDAAKQRAQETLDQFGGLGICDE